MNAVEEEVRVIKIDLEGLDRRHNDTREEKADKDLVTELDTKVDEFVRTDLRGNATFVQMKALDYRIASLETSSVPT